MIFRLFCHEALRVFHDRLISWEDKHYFCTILAEMANKHFGQVKKNNASYGHVGDVYMHENCPSLNLYA